MSQLENKLRKFGYRLFRVYSTGKTLKSTYGTEGLMTGIKNRLHGLDLLWGLENTDSNEAPKKHEKLETVFFEGVHILVPNIKGCREQIEKDIAGYNQPVQYISSACSSSDNPSVENCKARILLFSHELSRTGAPGVLLEAAKVMMKAGYSLQLIAPYFSNGSRMEMAESFAALGIPVFLDASLLNYRFAPTFFVKRGVFPFADLLTSRQDLLFMNSYVSVNAMAVYNRENAHILFWLHEGQETYRNVSYFPRKMGENTDVLCVGDYAKRVMAQYKLHCRPNILLYGIPDKAVSYPFLKTDKVRFILVGSIDPRKNQLLFLKAFGLLPKELQNRAEFVMVGGHFNQPYYEKVKTVALQYPQGKLLGSMPSEEIFKLYQKADCVVVPSIDDPMPVVATEGLMLSKILICSDQTGTASYIVDGKNGFVISPHYEQILAEKLRFVIENRNTPEMDSLRKEGRTIYETYFTPEIFRKSLLGYIQSNLNRSKR